MNMLANRVPAALAGLIAAALFHASLAARQATRRSPLGREIQTVTLTDFRGKEWSLSEFADRKAVVVAFVGVECPLVAHYAARLQELATKYDAAGVAFLAVDSNQQDSLAELAAFARKHQLEIPLVKDGGNNVADAFAAERTPEVFLLDAGRRVVYHGRIDDQFAYGVQRPKVERAYLTDA